MRIVLRENVEKLGRRGEVIKVADGFARNFLLPKKLALEATNANLKRIEQERKVREVHEGKEKQEFQALAARLSQLSLTAVRKVGENEALYGSVTNSDVGELLEKEGFSIDKRKILLDDPIKALGIYEVPVKLHQEVTATIKVWVVKE
ncbi:MAG TPA: 50S ribosomal protein L9 [Candidatus Polarisedimenticolia bacterium]|nr:50S ribosomal protein L9 [Candidatus Polarisedimenticolia bacterium]